MTEVERGVPFRPVAAKAQQHHPRGPGGVVFVVNEAGCEDIVVRTLPNWPNCSFDKQGPRRS